MSTPPQSANEKHPSSARSRLVLAAVVVLALLVAAGAYLLRTNATGVGGLAVADVAMVPRDAAMAFTLNVAVLRDTPIWKRVLELRDLSPETHEAIASLADDGGLDVFRQIDSVFVAYPLAVAEDGDFALIVHGGPFDEQRLVNWSRGRLKKEGRELASRDYAGRKVWSNTTDARPESVLLDRKIFMAGGKGWIEPMIDRGTTPGGSASTSERSEALVALLAKVNPRAAFWGGGLVSDSIRQRLKSDPRLAIAASATSGYVWADFKEGVTVKGGAQLGSVEDATAFASTLNQLLNAFRLSPEVAMSGLVPMLGAVKVTAKDKEVLVDIQLTMAQVEDLIQRAKGLIRAQ